MARLQKPVRGDVTLAIALILEHVWGISPAQDRIWAQVSGLAASRAHKRILMVHQAYIDDSFKPNGVYVLAGHIATAEQWAKFSKEWEEMLPYGVRADDGEFHFKMSQMAMSPERMERVGAFYRLIDDHDLLSISCKISIADLTQSRFRLWVLNQPIDWGPFTDPFFFTFRDLIDCVHSHRSALTLLPSDEKIDFIFDNNSKKMLIHAGWDDFLRSRPPSVRELFGATPRFEDDREFLPLQAADLWAWWIREWYEDGCPMVQSEDGSNHMVARGLVSSKKRKHATLISYNEEQIVDGLKQMIAANHPHAVVYDDRYGAGQIS